MKVFILVSASGHERAIGVNQICHVLQFGEIVRAIPLRPAGAEVQRNEMLITQLLNWLNASGLLNSHRGTTLNKINNVLPYGDGRIDNRPAIVLPSTFTALRIDSKKPVAGNPANVRRIKILKPLPVITEVNRPFFHSATDQHAVGRREIGPIMMFPIGNREAHRSFTRSPFNADTVASLNEIKLIPCRDHVAAVTRDVGSAHFRAGEAPEHRAVVGVQPEQHTVALHEETAVDRQWCGVSRTSIRHRTRTRFPPPFDAHLTFHEIVAAA